MDSIPAWLLIVPVLGFLVFVHELGHFVTAKWFGIKVTEFGFGFPPRMFGVRRGETIYSINWIPLGGFVKMVGEEDPSEPRSFARQSVAVRLIVLVAGSFMNVMVPIVIFTILFMLPHDTVVGGSVVVSAVAPSSPAAEAGIRQGDTILSVNGDPVSLPSDLIDRVGDTLGEPIELVLRRGALVSGLGESPEFMVTDAVMVVPRANPPSLKVVEEVVDPERQISLADARRYNLELEVGDTMRQGAVGVMIGLANARVTRTREPIWRAVPSAADTMWDIVVFTKNGVVDGLTTGSNPGLAGPVGIAQATGEIVERLGFFWLLQLTALISVSLAIINVLPIPALDGGRLMFVLIEWVRRGKKISPKREGMVHMVGYLLILILVGVISYFDIVRLVSGESLLQ